MIKKYWLFKNVLLLFIWDEKVYIRKFVWERKCIFRIIFRSEVFVYRFCSLVD